jgi:cytochrome bd-type quinol oxidase subunit 2
VVLPRVLAAAAGAWTLGYLVFYLWVIQTQDGTVAWWYVALLVLAAVSLAIAALGAWPRPALTVGFATSALAMLVGLLSIGLLLAPAVVATAVALVVRSRRASEPAAGAALHK